MPETRNYARNYADGTSLLISYPWGGFCGGRALCSDGKVRALARIAKTPDTFFSVPAAVKVGGKTVSGYVTIATRSGLSTATADDPARVEFHQVTSGRNCGALPAWPAK